ncbi:MAG: acetyltransferase [Dysgonamonadaceae bacterium]|nr:acetyltransferase [Dysgonamonadaceae bacterium]
MKQLLILGAGGMGKEILYTAQHSIGYGTEFVVKGFLDFPNQDWDTNVYPPILGIEDDYKIQSNDIFTCSIGNVHLKRKVCEKMRLRGAMFQTLIHKEANIRENVKIGEGTIVDWNATVGSDVIIGENCLIQLLSIVGHDCKIGNYSRIDTQCVCVGGVVLQDCATIHTGAVVSHKVVVENDATVAAMSFVIRRVKAGTTVQGNPAIKVDY